jgi:hypothetical protein
MTALSLVSSPEEVPLSRPAFALATDLSGDPVIKKAPEALEAPRDKEKFNQR